MANKTFNDVKLNMTLKVQNTRANLSSSKEDMAVQMGKIQKWYTDFTPLVFSKKKVDGVTFDQDIIHYATCSTAASTTSKTVTCTGFNLVTGAWILVRFTVTNTGAVGNLTLNVNGTGAKNIKYRNADLSSAGVLAANRTYMFVYDGTYYQLIGDLDTNGKLDSPVDIELGTGVSSTATAFDGSKNITIPVTAIKEAYLTWGGKDFTNDFSPFDAALNPRLGANRMEMTKAAGITIERSTDSGSTWTAVNVSDINKQAFMSSIGYQIAVSGTSTANLGTDAAKNIMRVTIDTLAGSIYTYLNKFIIYLTTGGCTGCYVKIRIRTQADFSAGNDTWKTWDHVNRNWSSSVTESNSRCPVGGWSGFNVININGFITYSYQSFQYRNIQFIFGCTTNTSTSTGMGITSIQGYGGVGWTTPSLMAKTGHLYSYDGMGAATFPSTISASGGTLTGSLVIKGTAASKPLITRGIYGSDGNGNTGDLYVQFTESGSIGKTYFGGSTYYISADGSTYNGSAAKVNGHTVEKDVPSDAMFTDTKVTQTNTTGAAAYRVLLSGDANDTTETTTARKSVNLQFNPSTGVLTQSGATFGGIIITRSESANGASIAFKNTNGILGYIGFTGDTDSNLKRWLGSNTNTSYVIHDTGNTSYTATVTSSTSGHYTIGTLKLGGNNVTIYGKDTVYTHPSGFTAKTTAGFYKYTVDTNGHVSAGAALVKSDITGLGISASDHTHSNYLGATTVSGNSYYGMAEPDGTDTEWIRTTSKGIIPYQSGSRGDGHAQLGTSTWYFSSSYIDNMYSGFINITGDLPYLRFQQTTSGSEYHDTNTGIKCYPGDTSGMNMVIQSGGNMIIGGGEFPTNFYNATKFAVESYNDASGEKTYIGSDNTVYVITNGNTIEDRKVFIFGANFVLAAGGNLVFRYGTYDSYTSNTLTSAATTTARTWTLPDKTGTIALTSDLVDTKVTQSAATGNNYRPLIMGSKYSSTAGASTLQDTVTDQVYANASLYANPSTGTIYGNHFNGQAYWLRHCYCFDDTSDFANYAWHKVASIKSTLTYSDHFITFLVKEKYSASYSNAGILRCRFRTSGSRVKEHVSLTWDYLISGATPSDGTAFTGNAFNTANFVAVWTNTASTSCEVEIWVKLINRYSCITFTVLDESRRNGDVFYEDWTLYNSAGHGSSIYTSGTGHIDSSACELFGIVSHRQLDTTLTDYVKQDSQSEDSWHSLTTTGFTSSSIQYRKYGSVVEITGNFRYTGATSAFSNFATLPSGYCPKMQRQLVFPVCPVGGSGAAAPNAMLRIATDGKMSLLSNNSSTFNNNTWIFNIMFII